MAKNSYQALDDAQSNWLNGFTSSLANLQDQSANVAGQVNGLFTDAFSGMGDAIANFATTGKLNFADLANSIISDLARMETRILMSQALSSILGAFATGPSGANMGYFGSFSQSATNSTASSIVGGILNAKGGVYDSPSLSRYSGGVYDTPHYFAFANGGVFGEDGYEAVMPLTRTSDGKLGVKSAGGSNVVVNITNQGQPVQAKQTGTRQQGNTTIVDMVLTAVATDVTQGGKTAQAMQQRFGLQRRGVPMGA